MPIFRTCLCWSDVRTGSVATAVLTMTLAFVEILLQIAIWTGNAQATEGATEYAPYVVYIPLAALDFLIIVSSLVLIVGLERDVKGRHLLLPWIAVVILTITYDIPVSIYFFAKTFPWAEDLNRGIAHYEDHMSPFLNGSNVLVELIVLVVFWCLKLILYVIGVLCVISRYQELARYRKKACRYLYDYEERPRAYYNDVDRPNRERMIPAITVSQPQAPPPRYPHDREERGRTDYRTPRTGYDARRYDPYTTATPYPANTPKIYPQHEFTSKGEAKDYYGPRY